MLLSFFMVVMNFTEACSHGPVVPASAVRKLGVVLFLWVSSG